MSYYGAGDYYGAGGPLDFLKGAVRTVARVATPVLSAIAPPVGIAMGAIGGALARPPQLPQINVPFGGRPGVGIGPIGSPAHIATARDPRWMTKDGRPRRIRRDGKPYKRPTMDPGNTRALTRASRRIDRFVGIARRAMRHTNYKVVSKSAGRRKK